jgi:hypothetical protein
VDAAIVLHGYEGPASDLKSKEEDHGTKIRLRLDGAPPHVSGHWWALSVGSEIRLGKALTLAWTQDPQLTLIVLVFAL